MKKIKGDFKLIKNNFVITIGREFGSQGHTIGEKLAQRLQVLLYDKNIVKEAAKKSGYDESLFEQIDEKHTTSLLFSIAMNLFPYTSKMERLDEFSLRYYRRICTKKFLCNCREMQ